ESLLPHRGNGNLVSEVNSYATDATKDFGMVLELLVQLVPLACPTVGGIEMPPSEALEEPIEVCRASLRVLRELWPEQCIANFIRVRNPAPQHPRNNVIADDWMFLLYQAPMRGKNLEWIEEGEGIPCNGVRFQGDPVHERDHRVFEV